MPIRLSYINARGEEAILDDDENSFAHELTGRSGVEFPKIKISGNTFSDGMTEVVSITLNKRSITLHFWADVLDIPHWEDKFDEVKSILLQTGQQKDNWGKLKIRLLDGHYVYLNCVYEKGLDSLVRDNNTRVKFNLTFLATDPYFYNGFEYTYTISQSDKEGYLYFNDATIVNTKKEAQQLTGVNDADIMWWYLKDIKKYYAIKPTTSLYMNNAKIFSKSSDAINATKENSAGNLWYETNTEGVKEYYTILPATTLFMRTADTNMGRELYIQCEKVYPEIVINGPAENISILNETTGRKIQLSSDVKLDINQQIVVCTTPRKRSIKRSGANLIPKLTNDSTLDWWLEHGNNKITFSNSAMTPETYLRFAYTERRTSIR